MPTSLPLVRSSTLIGLRTTGLCNPNVQLGFANEIGAGFALDTDHIVLQKNQTTDVTVRSVHSTPGEYSVDLVASIAGLEVATVHIHQSVSDARLLPLSPDGDGGSWVLSGRTFVFEPFERYQTRYCIPLKNDSMVSEAHVTEQNCFNDVCLDGGIVPPTWLPDETRIVSLTVAPQQSGPLERTAYLFHETGRTGFGVSADVVILNHCNTSILPGSTMEIDAGTLRPSVPATLTIGPFYPQPGDECFARIRSRRACENETVFFDPSWLSVDMGGRSFVLEVLPRTSGSFSMEVELEDLSLRGSSTVRISGLVE